jgi:hypothetical protein
MGQLAVESSVEVQVAGEWVVAENRGPQLQLGVAAAAGPWAGMTTMHSFDLEGPVSDGLSLHARTATAPHADAATYALSRAGMAMTPLMIQVASPNWQLDGGTLGTSVSDLAGTSLVGRGASLAARQPGWAASALAITPDLDIVNASGSMVASRLEVTRGSYDVATSVSRLRESRGATTRSLDAFALAGSMPDVIGGRFGAELAHRRHDGGADAGWAATYLRRSNDESVDVRYSHAPGGSRAFARAAEELSLNASRHHNFCFW